MYRSCSPDAVSHFHFYPGQFQQSSIFFSLCRSWCEDRIEMNALRNSGNSIPRLGCHIYLAENGITIRTRRRSFVCCFVWLSEALSCEADFCSHISWCKQLCVCPALCHLAPISFRWANSRPLKKHKNNMTYCNTTISNIKSTIQYIVKNNNTITYNILFWTIYCMVYDIFIIYRTDC